MAENPHLEAYIPIARWDLIALLQQEGRLPAGEREPFAALCERLAELTQQRAFTQVEPLRRGYAHLAPHPLQLSVQTEAAAEEDSAARFGQGFDALMKQARYRPLTQRDYRDALEQQDHIKLNTEIEFGDFADYGGFRRGSYVREEKQPRLWWFKKRRNTTYYHRVVLRLSFKDEAYFRAKGQPPHKLPFIPGKTYLYIYREVPRFDLELLFPNVTTKMTLRDLVLLIVPALGAGVAVIAKVLPHLLLVVGALWLLLSGGRIFDHLGLEAVDWQHISPIIIAALSAALTLGGFAARQYAAYQRKRLNYLKQMTESLFFRSLASHESVLQTVRDEAAEADSSEMILAYYLLLTSPAPLTAEELDDRAEEWLAEHFNLTVDFDIHSALAGLTAPPSQPSRSELPPLVSRDARGRLSALPPSALMAAPPLFAVARVEEAPEGG